MKCFANRERFFYAVGLKFNILKFANKLDNMAVKRYFDLPSTKKWYVNGEGKRDHYESQEKNKLHFVHMLQNSITYRQQYFL